MAKTSIVTSTQSQTRMDSGQSSRSIKTIQAEIQLWAAHSIVHYSFEFHDFCQWCHLQYWETTWVCQCHQEDCDDNCHRRSIRTWHHRLNERTNEQAKQSVRKIISSVGSINLGDDPNRVKFGFVAYRDHSDDYVTRVRDLTNENEILPFINSLVASGGAMDTPEAVIDGVYSAVN